MTASGISLPADDSLALDVSDDGPLVVDRIGPVWQTLDDLKALLPAVLRTGSSALRDAWLQTWGQAALVAQSRVGFVLEAQASPRYAENVWLDAWGDLLGKPRALGEDDQTYRSRLMTGVDLVSPTAIKTAVNNLLTQANVQAVIYNEPAVDQAFCGPATTSDPTIVNGRQQTIAVLQTWFAFTQPQIPTAAYAPLWPRTTVSGVATPNQTVYYAKNLRFWANYNGLTGNTKIGAFSAPLGAGFWIIAQGSVADDSLTPHSEPVSFVSVAQVTPTYDAQDFAQGITGATTPNQSSVQGTPSFTGLSYGYVPQAYDTIVDRINAEISRRRAAGVPWVFMVDLPAANSL